MQWHVHRGKGGPVLVQYSLANQQQLELWVSPPSIAEAGFIVNEVFNEHEYLKHGVTLQPGDTVVDVGANIGVFGARVLSLVPGGDVHYIGVEPCPDTFQLLTRNLLGTDGRGQQNSVFHINEGLSGPLQATAAAAAAAADGGGGGQQQLQQRNGCHVKSASASAATAAAAVGGDGGQQCNGHVAACTPAAAAAAADAGGQQQQRNGCHVDAASATAASVAAVEPGRRQQQSNGHVMPSAVPAPAAAAGQQGRMCLPYPANVQLVQTAVSSSVGSCQLTFYPCMPGNSTMRPAEKLQLQQGVTQAKFLEGATTLDLPVTTLPKLLAELAVEGPISLLKIDVEGEELEVLRGVDPPTWHRIQQVALEVHDCIDTPDSCTPAAPISTRAAAPAACATNGIQQPGGRCSPHHHHQQQLADRFQQQEQQAQQQQQPAGPAAAQDALSAALLTQGRAPRLQQLLNRLPGPRTCMDIDGTHIRYHPLPVRVPGQPPPASCDPANTSTAAAPAAAAAALQLPPPRDDGRVMAVAVLLRDQGFRVVIDCPFGLPTNYSVYGVRPGRQAAV